MSIASEITRINDAKEALKTSINNKLGSQTLISDEKIDEYSSFVDNIEASSAEQQYFGLPEASNDSIYAKLPVTSRILELPALDTSKLVNATGFVYRFAFLKKIPLLDFSKVTNLTNAFYGCENLTDVGGFRNLGSAYTTTAYDNLDLSNCYSLSVESASHILNHLGDVTSLVNSGSLPEGDPSVIFAESCETTFTANSDFMAQVQSAEGYGWTVTFK